MLAHCHARRIADATAQQAPPTTQTNLHVSSRTNAVLAQAQGFVNFTNLSTARRTISLPSLSRSTSNTPMPTTPTTPVSRSTPLTPILLGLTALSGISAPVAQAMPPTEAERAALLEAEEHAHDLRAVRNELHRYKEEPLFTENAPLDLVRYWDVSTAECLLKYILMLCNRTRKRSIHLSLKWLSTSCQSRPLLFLVSVPSHQVKKHAFFGEVFYTQECSKFCKF